MKSALGLIMAFCLLTKVIPSWADERVPQDQVARCEKVVSQILPHYKALLNRHPELQKGSWKKLVRWSPAACDSKKANDRVMKVYAALSSHSGKVGVILNYDSGNNPGAAAILAGMKSLMPDTWFSRLILVKDSQGNPKKMEKLFAQLVIEENVSLVVVGGDRESLKPLIPWSEQLRLPVLFLANEKLDISSSRFAFRVYPQERALAKALILAAKKEKWNRITLFEPDDQPRSRVVTWFLAMMEKAKMEVTQTLSYRRDDYRSMNETIEKAFFIDPKERRNEYLREVSSVKKKAQEAGVPYDPRQVILRPLIRTDAIFIPDNFRITKHFARLMRFHGVRRFPLIGLQSWRSQGLFSPKEWFLEGSIFADFIGNLHELPKGLIQSESPWFPNTGDEDTLDMKAIGRRAIEIVASAMKDSTLSRPQIAKRLTQMKSPANPLFHDSQAFDSRRVSQWPAYVFKVEKQSIRPLN